MEKNKVTGFLNAKKQPLRNHENILVFYKKQCKYYPQKTFGHKPVNKYTKKTSDGSTLGATKQGISGGGQTSRYPTTIKEFNVVNQDGTSDGGNFHPSQKPISLMEYLIKTYTDENDTVLDFAMGSGTTGVACKNTNRKFIGIEKNKDFFEIAKRRIMQ
jgi:DNA modification methylase